jgi:hypothetical protein
VWWWHWPLSDLFTYIPLNQYSIDYWWYKFITFRFGIVHVTYWILYVQYEPILLLIYKVQVLAYLINHNIGIRILHDMFNKVDFVIVLLELKNSIAFWDQYVKQNKATVTYWKFSINNWFLNTKLILYILFSWKLARWYTYGSGRILLKLFIKLNVEKGGNSTM